MHHHRSHIVLVLACLGFFPSSTYAQDWGQDFPIIEVSAGYSYLHIDTQGVSTASFRDQCSVAFAGPCPLTFQIHPGFNGWNLAPQFNFYRWFGIKALIAGQYGSVVQSKSNSGSGMSSFSIPKQHAYDVMFGPVISRRAKRYTLFAHGLFGFEDFGIATSQVNSASIALFPAVATTDTAFAVGGGADLKISKYFAVRAAQFDYEFVNTSNFSHQNDWRYSGGIVIAIGGK